MIFTDFIHPHKTLEEQFEAYKHLKYNKHGRIVSKKKSEKAEKSPRITRKMVSRGVNTSPRMNARSIAM